MHCSKFIQLWPRILKDIIEKMSKMSYMYSCTQICKLPNSLQHGLCQGTLTPSNGTLMVSFILIVHPYSAGFGLVKMMVMMMIMMLPPWWWRGRSHWERWRGTQTTSQLRRTTHQQWPALLCCWGRDSYRDFCINRLTILASNWLTRSCLVHLIDVTLACEDSNSKLVEVCYCC